MFTGIVQGLCEVTALTDEPNLRRLTINAGPLAHGADLGASVAINGTCLTVTRAEANILAFDVIRESLSLTNLGDLAVGDRVNVERSYRVGDEVGGHILSGHVSDVVTLAAVNEAENTRDLYFDVPERLKPSPLIFLFYDLTDQGRAFDPEKVQYDLFNFDAY